MSETTPMSDGRKKEIYRDVRFFHGAIQLLKTTKICQKLTENSVIIMV